MPPADEDDMDFADYVNDGSGPPPGSARESGAPEEKDFGDGEIFKVGDLVDLAVSGTKGTFSDQPHLVGAVILKFCPTYTFFRTAVPDPKTQKTEAKRKYPNFKHHDDE